jgi:hypothetical protein
MAISSCKWIYACFLLLIPARSISHFSARHPFYVSVTEINHNAKAKILEISCKMFTNDFEVSLQKYAGAKIDLSDAKNKPDADKSISGYIQKHLLIKVDGNPVTLQFVGSEKETDATWSYFQVENIAALKTMDVKNSLLYESFESEINIMHVIVNGNRQSTKLSNPDIDASFAF